MEDGEDTKNGDDNGAEDAPVCKPVFIAYSVLSAIWLLRETLADNVLPNNTWDRLVCAAQLLAEDSIKQLAPSAPALSPKRACTEAVKTPAASPQPSEQLSELEEQPGEQPGERLVEEQRTTTTVTNNNCRANVCKPVFIAYSVLSAIWLLRETLADNVLPNNTWDRLVCAAQLLAEDSIKQLAPSAPALSPKRACTEAVKTPAASPQPSEQLSELEEQPGEQPGERLVEEQRTTTTVTNNNCRAK
ncbi:hypothetical protein ST47_g2409 [Ascochyta rabiei]|uniref:Uncharacterized protein n=1 Tax=Didymella rabiei TaxID=5454 RepID=A0A163JM25_DIDRA|nr:hypothetical protein ST47_g2409 [Ascochyta rabiei]